MTITTYLTRPKWPAIIAVAANLLMPFANTNAAILNAPTNGTFTMNLDRNALAPYYGYFLAAYWNTAQSNYSNPANTGDHFVSQIGSTEISALNQVFDVTAIGANPDGQAAQRFFKATSANFTIDTDSLTGVSAAQIGMTGIQGFYAPLWPPSGGALINGDFSIQYDTSRQGSGWYLANNIYFTMAVYDFSHLDVSYTDANNWRLSGDLLMSPENAGMLRGAALTDVGDFCLGTGTYAGCGAVSSVPLPLTVWLFFSGLTGVFVKPQRLLRVFTSI